MTMKLIQKIEIGASGTSALEFTSIPQSYTHLYVLFSGRMSRAGNTASILGLRINGDTGTNYSWRILNGNSSSVASYSSTGTSLASAGYVTGPSAVANAFSTHAIYIYDYTGSSYKSISAESVQGNNTTDGLLNLSAGQYNSGSAVTSISFAELSGGTNLVQYTSAYLYGITAGSDGITAVS